MRSTASRAASNFLSGAGRLASSVIPEQVQRRLADLRNYLTGRIGPEQTSQVLNELENTLERIILRDNRSKLERVISL